MNFFKIIVGGLTVGCPIPFFMTLRIWEPKGLSSGDDVAVDVETVFSKFYFRDTDPRRKEIPMMKFILTSVSYEAVE